MKLLPTPDVTISDQAVVDVLRRAVGIINPLLDALGSDPLRVKRRAADFDEGPLDRVADGVTWALNAADVPGTLAWDDLDADARIRWWVRRVGALSTVAVAFPGVLGAVGRTLPIQDLLGFTSQAIVLCAVARELGVTDRDAQARMLAEVLCARDFSDTTPTGGPDEESQGIIRSLWRLVGLFDAIGDEIGKRPHPSTPFRVLGMLPGVGAVASYLGEGCALSRAAGQARRWVERHPV